MGRKVFSTMLLLAVVVVTFDPARAITFGVPDGNRHPNVGALIAEFVTPGEKDLLCSGTLISDRIFLTAGHCTAFLADRGISTVWVTFDPQFNAQSTLYQGGYLTNPRFNQSQSDPSDLAVVIFPTSLQGITPASLPPASLLDQMKESGVLKGQQFTAVGYGSQQRITGGGPPSFPAPFMREFAISSFSALNPAWLRLSQNPSTGDGGTCFGDSGGPNFFGNTSVIAAITVKGDSVCRSTNVTYRLDTQSAREFLSLFVSLP